jgi:hypothetical protein
MALKPEDPNAHTLSLKVGKFIDARASGWGILGIVVIAILALISWIAVHL